MDTTEPTAKTISSRFNREDVEIEDLNRTQNNNIREINIDIEINNNSHQPLLTSYNNNDGQEDEMNNSIQNFLQQQKQKFFNSQNDLGNKEETSQSHERKSDSREINTPEYIQPDSKRDKGKNKMTYHKNDEMDTVKICTHNVRGINRLTDQDNILQEIRR